MITTIGNCYDLHLSVLVRKDEENGDKTLMITCSKIERCSGAVGADRSTRQRTS